MEKEQIEFYCKKLLGLDIEEEDKEVGIFGNVFTLGFETKDKKVWLSMDDREFIDLLELLRPHFLKMEAEYNE